MQSIQAQVVGSNPVKNRGGFSAGTLRHVSESKNGQPKTNEDQILLSCLHHRRIGFSGGHLGFLSIGFIDFVQMVVSNILHLFWNRKRM